ncbi:MAG: hypothetical protein BGO63_05935 [Candidatus Accumulibacter sp. 66-26]|nr:MAG: hypothetical protein BGO63_05935 [Candidatus Accumulibacter sp. 66-26]
MDQGGLHLRLTWDGARVVAARVASTRRPAARVLRGLPAAQAAALAPRLFSLCAQAQGAAAQLALAAAQGARPDAATLAGLARGVALEAVGEHLWRLLLDWPPLLGCTARRDEFLAWRRRLLAVDGDAAARALGADLLAWLRTESVPAPAQAGVAGVALLPQLDAAAWAGVALDEDFAAAPVWAGQAAETGALARRHAEPATAALRAAGRGVAARLAARHADLHCLAAALASRPVAPQPAGWLDAVPLADGGGLARVETARGVLLHLTQVKDGRVGGYVIVAPTEWNFHPQGAFVREIAGCPAASRAQAEAAGRRLALALDPCVAYEIEVVDA